MSNHRLMNKIFEWLVFLFAILEIAGIILKQNDAGYFTLLIIILIWIIRHFNKKQKWGFTETHFSLSIIALFAHIFGENIFWFYYTYPHYDKVLHFLNPLIFTYIVSDSNLLKNRKFLAIFIVLGVVGLMEISEYVVDIFSDAYMQGVLLKNQGSIYMTPLDDTMVDMIFGTFSSILGYVVYVLKTKYLKKLKIKKNK